MATGASENGGSSTMGYTLSATLHQPFDEAVLTVRNALGEQGFGVLTEIDLAWMLRTKLGVEVPPQVILGACRPELAHQAIQDDPRVATLLPCNVVVRERDAGSVEVEVFDPAAMVQLGGEGVRLVADDARTRLQAALDSLPG